MSTTQLLTAEDLEEMGSASKFVELFDGVPREREGMSLRHGAVAGNLIGLSYMRLSDRRLGQLFPSPTHFVIARDPDTVVVFDLAFVRTDRLPPKEEWDRYMRGAPDLAIEVIDSVDRYVDIMDRIERYQTAGVPLIWLVEPRRRTVTVYVLGQDPHTLRESETLDGGDIVPGFTLPIAEIFR